SNLLRDRVGVSNRGSVYRDELSGGHRVFRAGPGGAENESFYREFFGEDSRRSGFAHDSRSIDRAVPLYGVQRHAGAHAPDDGLSVIRRPFVTSAALLSSARHPPEVVTSSLASAPHLPRVVGRPARRRSVSN